MGYQSNFQIIIRTEDEKLAKKVISAIEETSGYTMDEKEENHCCLIDAKWYDSREDIEKVSKAFPGVVIEMDVEGEDRYDNWSMRALNGKTETVQVIPFTPPFTEITIGDELEKLSTQLKNAITNLLKYL